MENLSKTELENEKWKDIEGYDGMYQVSDLGRVRSLKYGNVKMLKVSKDKGGYLRVSLSKHNKKRCFYVHRLVAQAFIPNDDETKTIINHRNSIRDCNRVDNLEWCDYQYNNTYNDIHIRKKNCIFSKIKDLYDNNLSIYENIDLFNEQGIECSYGTVSRLRQDLGLTRPHNIRNELKDLYNSELTINENLKVFKENGVDCCIETIKRLRQDLGLTRPHNIRNEIKELYDTKLSIDDNIKLFKSNGISCCRNTVIQLRRDLGLTRKHKPYKYTKKTTK